MLRLLTAVLLLLSAGCAPDRTPAGSAPANGAVAVDGAYKTIGLIVPPYHQLDVMSYGVTMFGYEHGQVDAASIELGNRLRHAVAQVLAPRYRVVDLPYVTVNADLRTDGGPGLAAKEAAAAAAAQPSGVDLYLVVHEAIWIDPFSDHGLLLKGCGVHHATMLILDQPPLAYCVLEMVLVDGHSLKPVGQQPILSDSGSAVIPDQTPHADLQGVQWSGVDLTPQQIAATGAALDSALAGALPYSLKKLGLVP